LRHSKGKDTRRWLTSGGVIHIGRRHWRCPSCAWSGYLADDCLGLKGVLSLRLRRLACLSTSTHSFAKSSQHLLEFCGVEVCAETLRQYCERDGRVMAQWLSKHTLVEEMFAAEEGVAEFQMDAGKVNTIDGWRDYKVGSFARRPLAEASSPSAWAERPLPRPTVQVLLAAVESIEDFKPRLEHEAARLGLEREEVHCLGDGADWIWKAVNEVFDRPRQTLDVYHGLEHFATFCKQAYGEGTALTQTRYERAQALLLHQGAQGVQTFVAEERTIHPEGTADVAARLADLENYFAKHAVRLNYSQNMEDGLPIGSGMIEGNVKTIGLRVKARGARWLPVNVGAMATLCCLSNSTCWHEFWTGAE
jgi:hypothetical protein